MVKKQFLSVAGIVVFFVFFNSFGETESSKSKPLVSYSGRFIGKNCLRNDNGIKSQNGLFQVIPQTKRQINGIAVSDINVLNEDKVIYTINNVYNIPQISNNGFLMAQRSPKRNGLMPSLACYDNQGKAIILKSYSEPVELYGFSRNGKYYGVGTSDGLEIFDCENSLVKKYEKGYKYTKSDDGKYVVVASVINEKSIITVYRNDKRIGALPLNSLSVREMDINSRNGMLAIVDRDNFTLINLSNLKIIKNHHLNKKDNISYVDVMFGTENIWVGQQKRNLDHSRFQGVLKSYNMNGELISSGDGASREKTRKPLNYNYRSGEYPWPFEPQNESHIVWNGYLAITGSSNSSNGAYLHQGLDIDVPANEPTVSVSDGFCKARLYIMDPSYLYWRVCVADEDVSTRTNGWMYAHLVEHTITVNPDDEVITGQVIGEIIKWDALSSGWDERGHIHFSRISDHGVQWSYTDDQWRNVCDPLMLLRPFGDTIPPEFLKGSDNSAFKFSTNEGSGYLTYLDPDELSDEVDVIIKMTDRAGDSKWWQPASRIYWWIKSDETGEVVHPRTIGLIKNQTMPNYTGSLYSSILPPVMHRMDYECKMYSSWTTPKRTYYHIITNNDGDSTVEESDKYEALDTRNFDDGDYWIHVEIQDVAGNISVDSQLVYFDNGIVSNNINNKQILPLGTSIKYNSDFISISRPLSDYSIKIYNARGAKVLHESTKSKMIKINREKISKGLYIVKLTQKSRIDELKLIIH